MKLSEVEARLKSEFKGWIDDALESLKERQEEMRKEQEELRAMRTDFMARIQNGGGKNADLPKPGIVAARMVRAVAAGKGHSGAAIDFAKGLWGEDDPATKGLITGIAADGGVLVHTEYSDEIIELLRPKTAFRLLAPTPIPMDTGVMEISRVSGGASSQYIGEATAQNASAMTFDDLRLVWKKLKTVVPLSNELVMSSSPRADQIVLNDMTNAMAEREDTAFIRDTGNLGTPKGVRYWAQAANITASAAADDGSAPTLAEVETDIRVALGFLEDNDVRMLQPGWMMSPRSRRYVSFLRGSQDAIAFPDMRQNPPTLMGFPVGLTNNIPNNLGGNTRESELYLVDFADVVIGEMSTLSVSVSQEATYTNSAGQTVSAWDRDETVIKVLQHHDMVVRHPESVAVITDIPYGA